MHLPTALDRRLWPSRPPRGAAPPRCARAVSHRRGEDPACRTRPPDCGRRRTTLRLRSAPSAPRAIATRDRARLAGPDHQVAVTAAGDEPCHDDHDTVQYFVCGRHHRGAWVARRGYRAVLLLRHMHTAAPIRKIAPRTVGPRRTVPASGEKPVCAATIPPARKPSPDTAPTQPSQRG